MRAALLCSATWLGAAWACEPGPCAVDADCCGGTTCQKDPTGSGNRCLAAAPLVEYSVQSPPPGPGWNKLARTPPMGWMSWERYRCDIDCEKYPQGCIGEKLYMAMADRLAGDGYLEAGYSQVSIDDCWEQKSPARDDQMRLAPDAARFPSGMKALGDYMHAKGLRFGIYSDEGTQTCGGYPASKGYEELDAKTFAEWGVDYLKLDGCYNDQAGYASGYPAMGAALQASGRNITYSCSWPAYLGDNESAKPWDAMIQAGCNLWRNWADIDNSWGSVASIIDHFGDYSDTLQRAAGVGHWNDMDMILAGDDHYGRLLTVEEAQTQMAIWSIMASPLIMSNDLRTVKSEYKSVLLNREVIAVNQDPLGKAGKRVSPKGDTEVWARELHGGEMAVALYNKAGPGGANVTVHFASDLLLPGSTRSVRDLWRQEELGTFEGTFTAAVPAHGVVLVRLTAPSTLTEIHV